MVGVRQSNEAMYPPTHSHLTTHTPTPHAVTHFHTWTSSAFPKSCPKMANTGATSLYTGARRELQYRGTAVQYNYIRIRGGVTNTGARRELQYSSNKRGPNHHQGSVILASRVLSVVWPKSTAKCITPLPRASCVPSQCGDACPA